MGPRRTTRLLTATAAVLALTLTGCGSDAEPAGSGAPTPEPSSQEDERDVSASTTELTVGEAATGRCMVPTPVTLAGATTAFEGTVVALEDGVATLEVDQWYTGEESDQVLVAAPDEDLQALLSAVDFEVGKTYLVSATDGQLSLCGFTAEKTPHLETLYTEAFAS